MKMAQVERSKKWDKSIRSLVNLGKLLQCEGCQKLSEDALYLGSCSHTFCLLCADKQSGGVCPVCQTPADSNSGKRDHNIENLISAYKDISRLFKLPQTKEKHSKESTSSNKDQDDFVAPKVQRARKNSIESLDSSVMSCTGGSKIDKRNPKGETQLHVACGRGNVQKVKELLLQGANPNTQDNASSTPLHDAVCKGCEEIVHLLLENGAHVNVPGDENETALHDAVACNKLEIVRLLIAKGADVHARNSRGLTPRDLCGNNEVMKAVLEAAVPGSSVASQPQDRRQHVSDQPVVLYGVNFDKKTTQQINKLSRPLGFKILSNYSSSVTHVLVRLDDPNVKLNAHFYSAVLQGQHLVDAKWIEESEKDKCLRDPSEFEVDATLQRVPPEGSASCRNALQQLPGLFNKCHFFLHGDFGCPSKSDMTAWIKTGGGTVLSRMPNPENISQAESVPYHAKPDGPLARCSHFILYDDGKHPYRGIKYNMSHIKALPVHWFMSCMDQFKLCDPY